MASFLRANLGYGPEAVVKLLHATHRDVAPGKGSFHMGLAWQIYTLPWYPAAYLYKPGGATGMHMHGLTPSSSSPSTTPTENPGG